MEFQEIASKGEGICIGGRNIPSCNVITASWARGSEGFTYPSEAGYPIDTNEVKYFLMMTHYNNIHANDVDIQAKTPLDNSGLRMFLTDHLRPNDAGVLSIGKKV